MYTHHDINKVGETPRAKILNEDIDEILRGEISAVEAYEQVIEQLSEDPELFRLTEMKVDHENAVNYWKKESRDSGRIPESDSSLWGNVVEAFVGTSKIIGDEAALIALKKGEEHGLSNYRKMLNSEKLKKAEKEKIENMFIPNQKKHIESIDLLLGMQ